MKSLTMRKESWGLGICVKNLATLKNICLRWATFSKNRFCQTQFKTWFDFDESSSIAIAVRIYVYYTLGNLEQQFRTFGQFQSILRIYAKNLHFSICKFVFNSLHTLITVTLPTLTSIRWMLLVITILTKDHFTITYVSCGDGGVCYIIPATSYLSVCPLLLNWSSLPVCTSWTAITSILTDPANRTKSWVHL